jgi:hypothetical protein
MRPRRPTETALWLEHKPNGGVLEDRMMKILKDNTLVLSLLASAIIGGFLFWRDTGKQLAVQEKAIAVLEKQVEQLNDAVTDLYQAMW